MTETLQSSLIGKVLAKKYRLLRSLSEGGMGEVFLAEHIYDLGEHRAIKIIRPEIGINESMRKRFLREVKITRKISKVNEHVVFVYDDYGFEDNIGYYVMELLQGTTLTDRIQANPGQLALSWALRITTEVCSAMETAHHLGVIHRDLKPDNIFLITHRGRPDFVKVVDFGIAKEEQAETRLTEFGKIAGTLFYMSPEQIVGPSSEAHKLGETCLDGRSDIYSLGCILFEMLTGRPPFLLKGKDRSPYYCNLLLLDHIQTPPPSVQEFRPDVPDDLAQIIATSLAKSPEARFSDMKAFANALMSLPVFDLTATPPVFPRMQTSDSHDKIQKEIAALASTDALLSSVAIDSMPQPQKSSPKIQTEGPIKRIFSLPTHLTASAEMSSLPKTKAHVERHLQQPSSRSVHTTLLLIGLLCIAILGLVGVLLFRLSHGSPQPATLWINSTPQNASIIRQGKVLGKTPYFYQGTVNETLSFQLQLKDHKFRQVSYVLTHKKAKEHFALRPLFATLWVHSKPSKTAVWIGEVKMGETPFQIKKSPEEQVTFRLIREGFQPYKVEYTFSHGVSHKTYTLVPLPKPKPLPPRLVKTSRKRSILVLTSFPSQATVWLNGKNVGTTPLRKNIGNPKSIRIVVSHAGYINKRISLRIRSGTQKHHIQLKPLRLIP